MIAKLSEKDRTTNKYDKKGRPLTLDQWADLIEDLDYARIKQDWTPNRRYFVSTVWVGLMPSIFETMIFGDRLDLETVRYNTLAEAKAGHKKLFTKYQKLDKANVKETKA